MRCSQVLLRRLLILYCRYTAAELSRGGFTAKELRGFRDKLKVEGSAGAYAGYTAKELRENGGVEYTAAELKEGGYSAAELRAAGWTAAELRPRGFSCAELHAGNFTAGEMFLAGYALLEIRAAKGTAASLRASGASAGDVKAAGYGASELCAGGYDAGELHAAGFAPVELMEGGFDPRQLAIGCGLRVGELLDMGIEVIALRRSGFTAKELFDDDDEYDGVTTDELAAAGFAAREIEALGKPVAALRGQYAAAELKFIGFNASELRAGGYSSEQLVAAGYSPRESCQLREMPSCKNLPLNSLAGPAARKPAPGRGAGSGKSVGARASR